MKRIFMATMIVALSNCSISATTFYESLSSQISKIGQSIESVNNVPVIGKLTNLLPMAVLAASLKECPIQTMMVLAAVGGYLMSQNPTVQEMMNQYEFFNNVPWINRNNHDDQEIDESIFVFDGQDDDNDSSEINLIEDKESEKESQNQDAQQLFL